MPILEAQTIGVPVITSGLDPMPHVAGEGALFCDPNRPEDIRSQLKKVIDDDALRPPSFNGVRPTPSGSTLNKP